MKRETRLKKKAKVRCTFQDQSLSFLFDQTTAKHEKA